MTLTHAPRQRDREFPPLSDDAPRGRRSQMTLPLWRPGTAPNCARGREHAASHLQYYGRICSICKLSVVGVVLDRKSMGITGAGVVRHLRTGGYRRRSPAGCHSRPAIKRRPNGRVAAPRITLCPATCWPRHFIGTDAAHSYSSAKLVVASFYERRQCSSRLSPSRLHLPPYSPPPASSKELPPSTHPLTAGTINHHQRQHRKRQRRRRC